LRGLRRAPAASVLGSVLTKARCRLFCSIGALPVLTVTRPISTMHTAKTQSVRQPQRNRCLLRPIAYYRHYGPAAWIDPVVLRAITISWND
jgi:hypothetical protein